MRGNFTAPTGGTDLTDKQYVDARAIPGTLVDAKGDILIGTADNVPARLPIGLDGQALVARPALANGMAWEPPSSAVTHEVLRSTDLTQAQSTSELILFSKILGAQTNVGRRFRFDFVAEIFNNSGAAVNYTVRFRLSFSTGTLIWQTNALSVPSSGGWRPFVGYVDVRMVSATVLRSSAQGTVGIPAGFGVQTFGVPLASLVAQGDSAGVAVNWSAGVSVVMTMQMGTANINASWTMRELNLTTYAT